jgi:hypothetical protein
MTSNTERTHKPLEEIEKDPNFKLIDIHLNKIGNEVLTFEGKLRSDILTRKDTRSGDTTTYPNVALETACNPDLILEAPTVVFTDETKEVIMHEKEHEQEREIESTLKEITYPKQHHVTK